MKRDSLFQSSDLEPKSKRERFQFRQNSSIFYLLFREPPLPTRLYGPGQHEGPWERGMFLPARGQRHEASRTPKAEAASTALYGSLSRRHPELHRPGGSTEAGIHSVVRLVVRWSHLVRDDHWTAAVLCRVHGRNAGQGWFRRIFPIIQNAYSWFWVDLWLYIESYFTIIVPIQHFTLFWITSKDQCV